MTYRWIESPVGRLLLAADGSGLREIRFVDEVAASRPRAGWVRDRGELDEAARQLEAYFERRRRTFDLALAPQGTEFQRAVWDALLEIPYGETTTYGDVAARIGRPDAVRAVGAANGANPLSIVVPCHRVIGRDGTLTGYGGGLDRKAKLLALERAMGTFRFLL